MAGIGIVGSGVAGDGPDTFNQPSDSKVTADRLKTMLAGTGWKEVLEKMSKEEIVAHFLAKTIKVNRVQESMHEAPRKREGRVAHRRRRPRRTQLLPRLARRLHDGER